jgi:hypothetical protein
MRVVAIKRELMKLNPQTHAGLLREEAACARAPKKTCDAQPPY